MEILSKDTLNQLISILNTSIDNKIYSIIIKLQVKSTTQTIPEFSIGRMSSGGSYVGYYDYDQAAIDFVDTNLIYRLNELFALYRTTNPKKRTLFFRYNNRRENGLVEIFSSSSMNLKSKITLQSLIN
tara:strand:- start:27 stop:410 length:384 start_codon:yes stop_codon:yes gene_type:complete